MIELNRGQFFWLKLYHVLILVTLCTRVSKNGERLNIDCILSVNYAYQFYWCQFFVIIITIIVRILSLTSPFLSFKSSLNGTKMSSHTVHTKTFVHFFFLVLNWKSEHLNDNISLYTEALLLKLWHIFTFLFSAMMYNKCDVFVCGHKWKCNSTEMDSLFSFH